MRSGEPVRDHLPSEILNSDGLDPSVGLVLYRVKLHTEKRSDEINQIQRGPKVTLFGRYGDTGRRLILLTNPCTEKVDNKEEVRSYNFSHISVNRMPAVLVMFQ